jgi:biopolymer transport protein TolR
MAIALRNEGAKISSNINVTPMVDVMLVLLIIFMVITPMFVNGVPVELARTQNPTAMADANKRDALLLCVMRDGQMFLGNERVTGDDLTSKVRDTMATRANKIVYVRTDARARYGTLVEAVDVVRSAGIDQLGLLTEQRRK